MTFKYHRKTIYKGVFPCKYLGTYDTYVFSRAEKTDVGVCGGGKTDVGVCVGWRTDAGVWGGDGCWCVWG